MKLTARAPEFPDESVVVTVMVTVAGGAVPGSFAETVKTRAVGGPEGAMTLPAKEDTADVLATPPASLAVVAIVVEVGTQELPIPQMVSALGAPTVSAGAVVSFGFGGAGLGGPGGETGGTVATAVGVTVGVGVACAVTVDAPPAIEWVLAAVEPTTAGCPNTPEIPNPKPRIATIRISPTNGSHARNPTRNPLDDAGVPVSPAPTLARIASATPVVSASMAIRERV